MDFDDLLTLTVALFHEHPDVLAHYQQRFQHMLVDEYQDTNRAQNEIVLLLAAGHRNVCVVGDSDQCLPPGTLVSTPDGPVPIEARRRRAMACSGTATARVHASAAVGHRCGRGPVRRAAGRRCRAGGRDASRGTPHHLVPARLDVPPAGGTSCT